MDAWSQGCSRMAGWLSVALPVCIPCVLALFAYDAVAIFLFRRGEYQLVPVHDLARAVAQDLGLVIVYAAGVTPRIMTVVAGYPSRTRRICLIMLGLGIAWYDVLCASGTRVLAEPPGLGVSLVVLFVIPIILAPWYVKWLRSWLPEEQ